MSAPPESSAPASPTPPNDLDSAVLARKKELRRAVRSRLKAMSQDDIESESERVWANLFELPEYVDAESVALFLSMPRGEIVTDTALARVLDDGKTLYVPRVGLDFEKCDMDMIKVRDISQRETAELSRSHAKARKLFYHDWPRNKWDIPEPPPEIDHERAEPGDIDLIVVPGLAFDRCGGRLGQGKGYYDRFIAKMKAKGAADDKVEDSGGGGDAGDAGEANTADTEGKGGWKGRTEKPVLAAVGLGASYIEGDGPQVPMCKYDYPMDLLILPTGAISISSDGGG